MTDTFKKIFYLHVGKTAGTSVNSFLSSHFQQTKVAVHVESNPDWYDKSKHEYFASKDFISGHISIKQFAAKFNGDDFFKFGMFRRPVDHIISHLAWVRHLSEPGNEQFLQGHPSWVQEISHNLSKIELSAPEQVAGFISGMGRRERALFDNAQSRYLLSISGAVKVSKLHIVDALTELDRMDLVGLMENFDETIVTLCRMMRWDLPQSVSRQNVTKNKYGMNRSNEALRKALRPAIWADNMVYRKAVGLLNDSLNIHLLGSTAEDRSDAPVSAKGIYFKTVADSIIGRFDTLDSRRITGWAFYHSNPDIPAYLKICLPTHSILVRADSVRKDLIKKGRHQTGRCGFVVELPNNVAINPGDEIDIVSVGTNRRLQNSPQIFSQPCS